MKFDWPILGHKNITEFLRMSILNNRISHAYLFHGPSYIGKTITAKNFIATLLCSNRNQSIQTAPCQKCIHCEQFIKNIHPDVYWVKKESDKKNISIEQIREIERKLSMGSFLNSYKIAIINDAHTLSLGAANSLLKTLEEPAAKTIIILLADSIDTLPETIISRSQILKFLPVSQNEIYDYLIKKGASREKAQNLTQLAQGKPGRALKFLEENDLWESYREKIESLLEIIETDFNQRFRIINNLIPAKIESSKIINILLNTLDIWESVLRDLILIKNKSLRSITNLFIYKELEGLTLKYKMIDLAKMIKEIKKTKKYLIQNVNPKLVMENLVLTF